MSDKTLAERLDWIKIAKAAGEHGVRYRTNSALLAFLEQIGETPPVQQPASDQVADRIGWLRHTARDMYGNYDGEHDHWAEGLDKAADMLERLAGPAQQPGADQVEVVARALAKVDGLDYDEVCGVEADPDTGECDSGTCVAALYEDHDPDHARGVYMRHARAALTAMQTPSARITAEGVQPLVEPDARGILSDALANCAGLQANGGDGGDPFVKVFFKSPGDQDALFVLLSNSLCELISLPEDAQP